MNDLSPYWRLLLTIVGTALALNLAWYWLSQALPLVIGLLIAGAAFALWRLWHDRTW